MTTQPRSLRAAVESLPSSCFAFVMASGIVSTAFHVIGQTVVSLVLLVVAIIGLIVLAVATVWRVVAFPRAVLRDLRSPTQAFGFLTVVAGIDVIGIRMYSPENPWVTIVLGCVSAPLWLFLTYGVPSALMLQSRRRSVVAEADGSWFLWVVATQSLATAAATIALLEKAEALAALAVGLWGIGVMLYLMLATLVTLRLLSHTSDARSINLNPTYWIYMGATAITVLAGSRILVMPVDLPIMHVTSVVVAGLTFVLWAFGVWWIPLLVVFGVWRHAIRGQPLRYEHGMWSIVFPLGMYSVASMHFGGAAHLDLLATIGEIGTWVAGLAWLGATVAMLVAFFRRPAAREVPTG